MQTKQQSKMLSSIVFATSIAFNLFFSASNVSAANTAKISSDEMIEFLDKNSTTPIETKTIKLGMLEEDDTSQLFSKEGYRKSKRKKSKAKKEQSDTPLVLAIPEPTEEKLPFAMKQGDYTLTFGGATKIEHYFQKNITYLNSNLPDEAEFFKNAFDFTVDFSYGEKKYGHKAVEGFIDLLHKGVWGKNGLIADAEPGAATQLKLDDTFFGNHSHTNGRPYVWIRDGWLRVSLNAIANADADCVHYLKIGWFPFDLGRGIALGAAFGLSNSKLGLYFYGEEKSAPGINLNGEIIKDYIEYDLYWSRYQERNKDLRSTIELVRRANLPAMKLPWRGLGKDTDLLAARLIVKPLIEKDNSLELEPYIMYTTAPDQSIAIQNDCDTTLGSVGCAIEQTYKNFEWGGEVAANFGKTTVFSIDKNAVQISADDNGHLTEYYSMVVKQDATTLKASKVRAPYTAEIRKIVEGNQLSINTQDSAVPVTGQNYSIMSAPTRYRESYITKYGGWMGVLDGAYNFRDVNAQLAVGVGYTSGDRDPNIKDEDGTYKGFVGINEMYNGKRVRSIIILDERKIHMPIISKIDDDGKVLETSSDEKFDDLVFGGMSGTWKPSLWGRKCTINPNGLVFWTDYEENKVKVNEDTGVGTLLDEKASRFLGTEINILNNIEIFPDFKIFANFAVFVPGGYFSDMKGLASVDKGIDAIASSENNDLKIGQLRSGTNTAFHVNVGFSLKF